MICNLYKTVHITFVAEMEGKDRICIAGHHVKIETFFANDELGNCAFRVERYHNTLISAKVQDNITLNHFISVAAELKLDLFLSLRFNIKQFFSERQIVPKCLGQQLHFKYC
jgi:hypothetical protein